MLPHVHAGIYGGNGGCRFGAGWLTGWSIGRSVGVGHCGFKNSGNRLKTIVLRASCVVHVNELRVADLQPLTALCPSEGDGEETFVDGNGPLKRKTGARQHELMLLLPEFLKPQCPTPSTTTPIAPVDSCMNMRKHEAE